MQSRQEMSERERDWKQLIERLGSDEFGERLEAGAALCGAGERTIQALVEGLSHPLWRVRWRCVEMLGHLAEEKHLELLCRTLQDPAIRVRRAAIHALLSAPCATLAAQSRVTAQLIECAVADQSVAVRRRAVHALGLRPYDAQAAAMLEKLAESEAHPKLRLLAQWALERQERKAAECAPSNTSDGPETLRAAHIILHLAPEAETPRLETLDAPTLVELLGAKERRLRSEAAGVLFHRGPTGLDAVVAGLDHTSVVVRRACASLLDHLADNRCVEPLAQALRDPDERVRRGALHSLTCDACKPSPLEGDLVASFVERALTDPKIRVRRVATGVLGDYLNDARAMTALQQIAELESDAILRSRASAALRRFEQENLNL